MHSRGEEPAPITPVAQSGDSYAVKDSWGLRQGARTPAFDGDVEECRLPVGVPAGGHNRHP